jgi:hypothetical protein
LFQVKVPLDCTFVSFLFLGFYKYLKEEDEH